VPSGPPPSAPLPGSPVPQAAVQRVSTHRAERDGPTCSARRQERSDLVRQLRGRGNLPGYSARHGLTCVPLLDLSLQRPHAGDPANASSRAGCSPPGRPGRGRCAPGERLSLARRGESSAGRGRRRSQRRRGGAPHATVNLCIVPAVSRHLPVGGAETATSAMPPVDQLPVHAWIVPSGVAADRQHAGSVTFRRRTTPATILRPGVARQPGPCEPARGHQVDARGASCTGSRRASRFPPGLSEMRRRRLPGRTPGASRTPANMRSILPTPSSCQSYAFGRSSGGAVPFCVSIFA